MGKNAKRHDLERAPNVGGSDLQYGDRKRFEEGMKVAPIQQQQRGQAPQTSQNGGTSQNREVPNMQIPDAIEFLGARNGNEFGPPQDIQGQPGGKLDTWRPILERIALGTGSSGGLASLYIQQMRRARQQTIMRPAVQINLDDIDAGIEGMVQELERE